MPKITDNSHLTLEERLLLLEYGQKKINHILSYRCATKESTACKEETIRIRRQQLKVITQIVNDRIDDLKDLREGTYNYDLVSKEIGSTIRALQGVLDV